MGRQTRNPRRSPTTPNSGGFDGPSLPPPLPPSTPGGQTPLYLCSPFVEAALVKGNFKTIAMLPKYVEVTEWVAVNSKMNLSRDSVIAGCKFLTDRYVVYDFYQNLNLFYGIVTECCTSQNCPTMSAGPKYVSRL